VAVLPQPTSATDSKRAVAKEPLIMETSVAGSLT
jgi:hypothetical protein